MGKGRETCTNFLGFPAKVVPVHIRVPNGLAYDTAVVVVHELVAIFVATQFVANLRGVGVHARIGVVAITTCRNVAILGFAGVYNVGTESVQVGVGVTHGRTFAGVAIVTIRRAVRGKLGVAIAVPVQVGTRVHRIDQPICVVILIDAQTVHFRRRERAIVRPIRAS